MKKIILLLLMCLLSVVDVFAESYSVNVGSQTTVYCTHEAPAGYIHAVYFEYYDPNDQQYLGMSYNSSDCCATLYGLAGKNNIKLKVTYAYTYETYYSNRWHKQVGHASYDIYVTVLGPTLPTKIDLTVDKYNVNVNEVFTITTKLTPANATASLEYSTLLGFPGYIDIIDFKDDKIVMRIRKAGFYAFIATASNGVYGVCQQNVVDNPPTEIHIPSTAEFYAGEQNELTYSLIPTSSSTSVTWYSRDESTVKIADNKIIGVKEGKANVYCKTDNGLLSNDCEVTVKVREATGIKIPETDIELPIGHSRQLLYEMQPYNAGNAVSWSCDNRNIATVDPETGVVTAISAGTAKVKVTTDNGYSAYCNVTVLPDASAISLPQNIYLILGKQRQLKCTAVPSNAYYTVTWQTSDSTIVSVDQSGNINALNFGIATITGTSNNGLIVSTQVTVPDPEYAIRIWMNNGPEVDLYFDDSPEIMYNAGNYVVKTKTATIEYPTSIIKKFTLVDVWKKYPLSICIPESIALNEGEAIQVDYILDAEQYDIETKLTWTSSNPKVATVDSTGLVTAVYPGSAVISVSAENGKSAESTVYVSGPDYYLHVWQKDGSIVDHILKEHPEITWQNNMFVIKTEGERYEYPFVNFSKYTISKDQESTTGIDRIISEKPDFDFANSNIIMQQLRPNSVVNIYSISGILVLSVKADTQGMACISTHNLPKGNYIVKSNSITFKFNKK